MRRFSVKISNGSFSATRRSWMASDSLLDSYIYVAYKNKKMVEKNFSEKYFFDRQFFLSLEIFWFFKFSWFSEIFEIFETQIFFWAIEKIFFGFFFRSFFYFRKLRKCSYLASCRTLSNSSWSLRTSHLKFWPKKLTFTPPLISNFATNQSSFKHL